MSQEVILKPSSIFSESFFPTDRKVYCSGQA